MICNVVFERQKAFHGNLIFTKRVPCSNSTGHKRMEIVVVIDDHLPSRVTAQNLWREILAALVRTAHARVEELLYVPIEIVLLNAINMQCAIYR